MRRALVVTEHWPWPGWTGARQRIGLVVTAVAELYQVDIFHIDRRWRAQLHADEPPAGVVSRWTHQPLAAYAGGHGRRWAARLLPPELAQVAGRAEDALRAWTAGQRYDLIWCNRESALAAVDRALPDAPLIVDIDDLGEVVSWRMRAAAGEAPRWGRSAAHWTAWRWRRVHRATLRRAVAGLVCSEVDRARLGAPNALVLPNVSTVPVRPPRRRAAGAPPTVVFQGLFTYAPNAQAARLLATEVLPRVRAELPTARVLLLGHHAGELDDLAGLAGVELTGVVDDMPAWLSRADLAAVPLRIGGGTRIKIMEAIRCGLPVVATEVAAEGLGLISGQHAYIADDTAEFADCCVRLLRSPQTATQLVRRSQQLVAQWYDPAAMQRRVQELALPRHGSRHPAGVRKKTP